VSRLGETTLYAQDCRLDAPILALINLDLNLFSFAHTYRLSTGSCEETHAGLEQRDGSGLKQPADGYGADNRESADTPALRSVCEPLAAQGATIPFFNRLFGLQGSRYDLFKVLR
jgi:hypothetical protein